MNLKRIYIFLIIVGAVIVLTSVIDFLQGNGFNAIPFGGGFIIIAAGMNLLRKLNKKNSKH